MIGLDVVELLRRQMNTVVVGSAGESAESTVAQHGRCFIEKAVLDEVLTIVENADRLAIAADSVMQQIHPPLGEEDAWMLRDWLRSRLFSYTLARDGVVAAMERYKTENWWPGKGEDDDD